MLPPDLPTRTWCVPTPCWRNPVSFGLSQEIPLPQSVPGGLRSLASAYSAGSSPLRPRQCACTPDHLSATCHQPGHVGSGRRVGHHRLSQGGPTENHLLSTNLGRWGERQMQLWLLDLDRVACFSRRGSLVNSSRVTNLLGEPQRHFRCLKTAGPLLSPVMLSEEFAFYYSRIETENS